jgi:serine/threonine protein kinase
MTDEQPKFDVNLDGFPTQPSNAEHLVRLPLEVLLSRFMDEHRRGLNPSVDDYARRFSFMESEIREYFPVVAAMERWKGDTEAAWNRLPERFPLQQLGDCRIVREIGRGGMGVVFEAIQEKVQRRVAVKVLAWRYPDSSRWRQRFECEAQTVAKLKHRNIVSIFSFGEQDGYWYFVMPFVDGVGLDWIISRLCQDRGVVYAEEITRRQVQDDQPSTGEATAASVSAADGSPWQWTPELAAPRPNEMRSENRVIRRDSWRTIARIGLQVAQSLHYAHGQSTLHNDIKPANLLLDASGHVWVTDFGLAEPLRDEAGEHDERLTGTLRFMAPERFQGQRDARSDVYSLGITLYELVTRTPAFSANEQWELVGEIVRASPSRPRRINPEIPVDLETVILNAIAGDPEKRYTTARRMADDLLRFLNHRRVKSTRRTTLWNRRPFRRSP